MIAFPRPAATPMLDRIAIALSGLCIVHCVATSLLVAMFATLGATDAGLLDDPIVHEVGLMLAVAIGAVALLRGVRQHRRAGPAILGAAGIATMASALRLPHGAGETLVTITGVTILGIAHVLNHRGCAAVRRR